MQIKGLHKNIYTLFAYALRQENLSRHRQHPYYEKVHLWEKLFSQGVGLGTLQEVVGISRATYYRYKKALNTGTYPKTRRPKRFRVSHISEEAKICILKIRQADPTYGKGKIVIILKREYGIHLSESSVGRVLKSLMDKGEIRRSLSAFKPKRKRKFTRHAKRWQYGSKSKQVGELIQIDHMTVCKNQLSFKHFQAYDPISKTMHAEVHSQATSRRAKKFLLNLIKILPFPILSIQVDGGSEFMLDFEQACADLDIPLFVLPPRRPQYNGGVERGNRTFREEFYARDDLLADSVGAMRLELAKAVKKYNTYRPHFALKGMTPFEYTQQALLAA